jgi:hypothetical protein
MNKTTGYKVKIVLKNGERELRLLYINKPSNEDIQNVIKIKLKDEITKDIRALYCWCLEALRNFVPTPCIETVHSIQVAGTTVASLQIIELEVWSNDNF